MTDIRRDGQYVMVTPPVRKLMNTFTAARHIAVDDPKHGVSIRRAEMPLAWPCKDELWGKYTQAYAGLEPAIKAVLEEQGHKVRLTGQRPRPLPRPKCPKSGGDAPDNAVLDFIRNNERGIIRFDPVRVQIDRLISQIAEAYPKSGVLILTNHDNDVHYLFRRLKARGLPVRRVYTGSPCGRSRIVVATYMGSGAGICEAERRSIVLYANPSDAFCKWGCESLRHLWRARVYGLMPVGSEPPSPTRDLIRAVFGEMSVSVPRHGRTARKVRVAMVASRVAGSLIPMETEISIRQRLIWHHPVRNRRIAQVAKTLAAEDYRKLGSLPPNLAELAWDRLGGRVGVLVASVEHGLELRRHLRDWPLLIGKETACEGLSQSDRSRVSPVGDDRRLLTASAIVTPGAVADAGYFDVIIRADAGVDLPELGGTHLAGHHGLQDDLLLVDFDDRHHPAVRKWTRARKAAYEAIGWDVVGGPEVTAEDRRYSNARVRQPVLPYQTPYEHRMVKGAKRTAAYHYEKRRERRREQLRREDGGQITRRQIADPDHLMDCFRKLVRDGGPAAGNDGISPRDISMSDFGEIAPTLSQAIMENRWQPQKTRPTPIPKPGTDEQRVLKIGTLLDRVVSKAQHVSLQPVLEKAYLRHCHGFRKGHSVWQMIAEIEATMDKYDRHMLVIADVRKAFDNVRIKEAIEAHKTVIQNTSKGKQPVIADDVLELIETMLRGHDNHDVGIDQGGCYCPDALNTFVLVVHDIPLNNVDAVLLWFRYADNLVYVVQSTSEGHRVLTRVRRLLRKVGLSLKEGSKIIDLDDPKEPAEVLGFRLWREDKRLRIGLGKNSLNQFREHLAKAWETSDPNTAATTILRLWINAQGPALESGVSVIPELLRLAAGLGFRELPGHEELRACWEEAWERWRGLREKVRRRVLRRIRH